MIDSFDLSQIAVLLSWVVAIVAAVRKQIPAINGPWVLVATAVCSGLVAAVQYHSEPAEWAQCAILLWAGAVGGVSFLDRTVDRVSKPGR